MFQQELEVHLEGLAVPVRITTDQRDVAQVEMLEWYGQTAAPLTVLRHLAYTCLKRRGHIPADTTWERFNIDMCINVDSVDDDAEDQGDDGEGEQGPDPTHSTPGPTTSNGDVSSTSPRRRGSRSPGRPGSSPGTPGT